jgi:CBS domain-containing protein
MMLLILSEIEVAPLWDLQQRNFIGMMTVGDYIRTLKKFQDFNIPNLENITIAEMLTNDLNMQVFRHTDFECIDAEDNVYQLCCMLKRSNSNYVPVMDPDGGGNLVAILGYHDILHMLAQAAHLHPTVFSVSIESLGVINYHNWGSFTNTSSLSQVISVLEEHKHFSGVPIISSESNTVIGYYQDSDVAFINKILANDPNVKNINLNLLSMQEIVSCQQEFLYNSISSNDTANSNNGNNTTEIGNRFKCTCHITDTVKSVIDLMVKMKMIRLVVVDHLGLCVGIVELKDIIWYYFNEGHRTHE